MKKTIVNPPNIAPPAGNYSHSVRLDLDGGSLILVSGQVAIDENGSWVEGDMTAQAECVFRNLAAILEANGATFADVVKMDSFLTDMADLQAMREVRLRYLPAEPPASTTVQVAALFRPEALLEVEVVAAIGR
jgi:2-iminobutanoate/2-iminopropanoate deaminase